MVAARLTAEEREAEEIQGVVDSSTAALMADPVFSLDLDISVVDPDPEG